MLFVVLLVLFVPFWCVSNAHSARQNDSTFLLVALGCSLELQCHLVRCWLIIDQQKQLLPLTLHVMCQYCKQRQCIRVHQLDCIEIGEGHATSEACLIRQ